MSQVTALPSRTFEMHGTVERAMQHSGLYKRSLSAIELQQLCDRRSRLDLTDAAYPVRHPGKALKFSDLSV